MSPGCTSPISRKYMIPILAWSLRHVWFLARLVLSVFPFVSSFLHGAHEQGVFHSGVSNRLLANNDPISVPWIVPIIGTAFFAPGFYLTFQSILNYLGESYPRYVASVFAGNTFFRSSFGGALPLAAPRMLDSLGIGWASSVLGFIAVAMVPLPFILERVGK